jgi:hypothetical protein
MVIYVSSYIRFFSSPFEEKAGRKQFEAPKQVEQQTGLRLKQKQQKGRVTKDYEIIEKNLLKYQVSHSAQKRILGVFFPQIPLFSYSFFCTYRYHLLKIIV